MGRKFVFYLKNNKVVITDNNNNDPIDYVTTQISDIMSGTKLGVFKTKTDTLLTRPEEIRAVHLIEDHKDRQEVEIPMDLGDDIEDDELQTIVPDINLDDIVNEEPETKEDKAIPELDLGEQEQKQSTDEETTKEETPNDMEDNSDVSGPT